jgi:hypothetical protein
VTKLHVDMADAVNILVDCQPGGDGMQQQQQLQKDGGAVWDIFARGGDALKLSSWLQHNAAGFSHMGESLSPVYPTFAEPFGTIHSQLFMLQEGHREALAADAGDVLGHGLQHADASMLQLIHKS